MTNIFLTNSKLWRKWGESDRERKKKRFSDESGLPFARVKSFMS